MKKVITIRDSEDVDWPDAATDFGDCDVCGSSVFWGDRLLAVGLTRLIHLECFPEFAETTKLKVRKK